MAPRDTNDSIRQAGPPMTRCLIANAVAVTSDDLTASQLADLAEQLNDLWKASAEAVAAAYGLTISIDGEILTERQTRARVGLTRKLRVA